MAEEYSKPELSLAELMERVLELENQLEEQTDRVTHRVMEVTTKIRESKPEMTRMMGLKQEMERLTAQKKLFEQNTEEKLSELEFALHATRNAIIGAQADLTSSKLKHVGLKQENNALDSSTSELSTKLQEILARGKKHSDIIESQEKTKMKYAAELEAEKDKSASLREQCEEAEEFNRQLEAMLDEEVKAIEELKSEASELKGAREILNQKRY